MHSGRVAAYSGHEGFSVKAQKPLYSPAIRGER